MKRQIVDFVRRLVGFPIVMEKMDAIEALAARGAPRPEHTQADANGLNQLLGGKLTEVVASLKHTDDLTAAQLAERLLFVAANAAFRSDTTRTSVAERAEAFGVCFEPVGRSAKSAQTPAALTANPLVRVYGDGNLWEKPIQICAADFVTPDSQILDIGGNIGALATAFSKFVPNGRVYTFEPNPDMWPTLHETLKANHADNVTIIPAACFSESMKLERFFSEPGTYKAGSRLGVEIPGARPFDVLTLSVDDFCNKNSISPAFVKIDVEGAEIHVLRSASQMIDRCRPGIVFEYLMRSRTSDMDPMAYLAEKGYAFYDVNSYDRVSHDFYAQFPTPPLVNVLAVAPETPMGQTLAGMHKQLVHREDVSSQNKLQTKPVKLTAGRYVVSVKFEMPDEADGGLGVNVGGKPAAYYGAKGMHLKDHANSNLVVELNRSEKVSVTLSDKSASDRTRLSVIEFYRVVFAS